MIARTQLAILDFNCCSGNVQVVSKDGSLRYKQVFSRVTQSWVVKKIMKTKERPYLYFLLEKTIKITKDLNENGLPIISDIPKNIATKEKLPKEDAINNMRTRFKN